MHIERTPSNLSPSNIKEVLSRKCLTSSFGTFALDKYIGKYIKGFRTRVNVSTVGIEVMMGFLDGGLTGRNRLATGDV